MFYGGVVVPVGSHVLGSDTQQGFITQAVTNYLNAAGIVCLLVWSETLWHERKHGVFKWEWLLLILNAGMLLALIGIHFEMDRLLDGKTTSIVNHVQFGLCHKLYIGTSSLQWLVSLSMLFLLFRRWSR
jgi:hypothetical protein